MAKIEYLIDTFGIAFLVIFEFILYSLDLSTVYDFDIIVYFIPLSCVPISLLIGIPIICFNKPTRSNNIKKFTPLVKIISVLLSIFILIAYMYFN